MTQREWKSDRGDLLTLVHDQSRHVCVGSMPLIDHSKWLSLAPPHMSAYNRKPIIQRSSREHHLFRTLRLATFLIQQVVVHLASDAQYFGQAILHVCHIVAQIPCYECAAHCLCFLELSLLRVREVFVQQLTQLVASHQYTRHKCISVNHAIPTLLVCSCDMRAHLICSALPTIALGMPYITAHFVACELRDRPFATLSEYPLDQVSILPNV